MKARLSQRALEMQRRLTSLLSPVNGATLEVADLLRYLAETRAGLEEYLQKDGAGDETARMILESIVELEGNVGKLPMNTLDMAQLGPRVMAMMQGITKSAEARNAFFRPGGKGGEGE